MRLCNLALLSVLAFSSSVVFGASEGPAKTPAEKVVSGPQVENDLPTSVHELKTTPTDDLPGISTALKLIDSPLEDIQWADQTTVFVVSTGNILYRSADSGKTWTAQTAKLEGATTSADGGVASIHLSPTNPNYIFIVGVGKYNWFSTDMGKTFSKGQEINVHDVNLHPTNSDYLLAASLSDGCDKKNSNVACFKSLMGSKDFGKTWNPLLKYVVQFQWAPNGAGHSPDIIFAAVHNKKVGDQKFGEWDANIDFVVSGDFCATAPQVLVKHGNRFLASDTGYIFVATVNTDPKKEDDVSLMISSEPLLRQDDGLIKAPKFSRAKIPVSLSQHSYTILDLSEKSVFLHVNHNSDLQGASTGNVYISDAAGLRYSLSLKNNRRDEEGRCDFEKVQGLEGIYMANFVEEVKVPEGKGFGGNQAVSSSSKKSGRHITRHYPKTAISFDKGATWRPLKAPEKNVQDEPYPCKQSEDGCQLHLHGISDMYGPFYSSPSAVGIVMGTGTVGKHLKDTTDGINTFLSRDAGLTWFEVARGSHIYEFGDHGSLIVMANDNTATDRIYYSWDEGMTWKSHRISDTPFYIENIIIEPEATSERFVVYGYRDNSGVLAFIDFTDLHQRQCVGADAPDTSDSDYQTWSPSDGRPNGKCLLGHTVKYTRRKREAQCFNPEKYETSQFVSNCVCTAADFECDYGFKRNKNKECVPEDEDLVTSLQAPPDECLTTYPVTQGYRRIAGDTCEGGVDAQFAPIVTTCPGLLARARVAPKTTAAVLLLILGALGVWAVVVYRKFIVKKAIDMFPDLKYTALGQNPTEPDTPDQDDFGFDEELGNSAQLLNDSTFSKFSMNTKKEESDKDAGRKFGSLSSKSDRDTKASASSAEKNPTSEIDLQEFGPDADDDGF